MSRLIALFGAFVAATAAQPAVARQGVAVVADPDCAVVRILPSGRRVTTPPAVSGERRAHGRSGWAHAGSSGRGASSSSASAASSSGGGGRSVASASSSVDGRTITTTHDENGCTVVIDQRGRGARR